MKPFPPCYWCRQTVLPTAYMGGLKEYLCQKCLERMVGELFAFRWGQSYVGCGNCACYGVNVKGDPSPWQENALRDWEDAES